MRKPLYQRPWIQAVATILLWALAVGGALFWLLHLPSGPTGAGEASVAQNQLMADRQGLARLLGAIEQPAQDAPAPARTSVRYELVGILAGTNSRQGAALISIDGKAAKTYRIGSTVEGGDGFVIQALEARKAHLGSQLDGPSALVLDVPEFSASKMPIPTPTTQAANTPRLPQRHAPQSIQRHEPQPDGVSENQ